MKAKVKRKGKGVKVEVGVGVGIEVKMEKKDDKFRGINKKFIFNIIKSVIYELII